MTLTSPPSPSDTETTADTYRQGGPSVSVIIAAYTEQRWPDTVEAVTSALNQSQSALEVILVIDHNPGLAERARAELRGVAVLENTGPQGASGARNTGVMASRGEIVVFLDDDAVATPDWLRSLCRHFDDEDVVGVGGGLTPAWPDERPRWFPREFYWVVGASYTGMPEAAAPMRNVWTGNMAIRRTVFDAVDGFRPGFGKTGRVSRPEDTDLCLRVRQAVPSGHWMYEPAALVAHKVPADRSTPTFFLTRCWNEGRGKAALSRLVGIDDSTAAERRYASRVLPRGCLRELYLALRHLDVTHLQRCAAIVAGLLVTAAGMVTEMVIGARTATPRAGAGPAADAAEPFRPILVAEWEVSGPLPGLFTDDGPGPISLLVRLGSEPLGIVDFDGADDERALVDAVWQSLGTDINTRLAAGGLPVIDTLSAKGVACDPADLAFTIDRERLLGDAPQVSVVICTRDRASGLAECVERVANQDYPNFEIVVVDNAPADPNAVPAALAALDVSVPVRYLREPRAGLSWARNTGWRAAQADIIAFIDDDEVPDRHWLAELVRGFATLPTVGCVSGAVLPAELRTEPQHWFEQFGGHSKGRGFTREVFDPDYPQSPLYPLPPFGAGANMAFRREVLADIGGFHVALGAGTPAKGSEDTYAFTRLLLARHTMVYQPTSITWHYHRETVAELESQLHGYGTGLVGYYLALIVHRPALLLSLIRLVPNAVRSLRGKDAVRTATMTTFPPGLLRAELQGMREGVPAYIRSVRQQRRKAPHTR
ncbi:glycosyltransferase family 2 protein [Mycobacterium aquaticum]|uniref:glycosyltransferase family 2 protein n=1 Tax=Mycobacterium aquaticum TaxID=1927124 RepID=UPI0009F1AB54|nr:glycosyltransferase [Mycobacterium aquaticum]